MERTLYRGTKGSQIKMVQDLGARGEEEEQPLNNHPQGRSTVGRNRADSPGTEQMDEEGEKKPEDKYRKVKVEGVEFNESSRRTICGKRNG